MLILRWEQLFFRLSAVYMYTHYTERIRNPGSAEFDK